MKHGYQLVQIESIPTYVLQSYESLLIRFELVGVCNTKLQAYFVKLRTDNYNKIPKIFLCCISVEIKFVEGANQGFCPLGPLNSPLYLTRGVADKCIL